MSVKFDNAGKATAMLRDVDGFNKSYILPVKSVCLFESDSIAILVLINHLQLRLNFIVLGPMLFQLELTLFELRRYCWRRVRNRVDISFFCVIEST